MEAQEPSGTPSERLAALLVASAGRIGLVVHGPDRWRQAPGCMFLPAELPGARWLPEVSTSTFAAAVGRQQLGAAARSIPSRAVYGPSPAHAIDRLATAATGSEDPLPVLRFVRGAPMDEDASGRGFRRVQVEVFLAALDVAPRPVSGYTGLLWLTPHVLRVAMRGLPFAETVAREGVMWQPTDGAPLLPGDALLYIPGDYGERLVLRIEAKYGRDALFQGGGGDESGE